MKRYHPTTTGIMKWHNFVTYGMLPLTVFAGLGPLINGVTLLQEEPEIQILFKNAGFSWVLPFSMTVSFIIILLCIIAFFGLWKRKWFGVEALLWVYAVETVAGAVYVWLAIKDEFLFGEFGSYGMSLISRGLLLMGINLGYYNRRRNLFSPAPAFEVHTTAQTVQPSGTEGRVKDEPKVMDECAASTTRLYAEGAGSQAKGTSGATAQTNSTDLLMQLQAQAEEERKRAESEAQGLKKRGVPAWVAVVLGCAVVMLGVSTVALFGQSKALEAELAEAKHQINAQEAAYKRLKRKEMSASAELDRIRPEYLFWRGNAVIVTANGEKYHRYDCQFVRDKSFYIYNVQRAGYLGYQPCAVCRPPTR